MSYNYISPLSIEEHPVEVVDGIKAEEMGAAVGKAFDDEVRKQVVRFMVKCDVKIDEQEMLKALEYDRGQYEKGYADGKADSRKVGRWMPSTVIIPVKNTDGTYSNFGTLVCSSCNNPVALVKWNNYCPCCGADMRGDR